MGLAPVPNAPGIVRPAEIIAVGWLAQPPALTGQFAGLPTSRLAAVMLVMLVAVIGEEKLAATAALTSLGPQTHREPKPPRPGRKEKPPNARREEGPGAKKEETISAEGPEENPPEENTTSNRHRYRIFIPPLTFSPPKADFPAKAGGLTR